MQGAVMQLMEAEGDALPDSSSLPVLQGHALTEQLQICVGARLGGGAAGRVYEALYNGVKVACKVLHPHAACKEDEVSSFLKEAHTLAELAHTNIIRVLAICHIPPAFCGLPTRRTTYGVLLELAEAGTLSHAIRSCQPAAAGQGQGQAAGPKRFSIDSLVQRTNSGAVAPPRISTPHGHDPPQPHITLMPAQPPGSKASAHAAAGTSAGSSGYSNSTAISWCLDIARALDHLHSQQPPIVHRDVKPDNVMLVWSTVSGSGTQDTGAAADPVSAARSFGGTQAKLGDFGMHVVLDDARAILRSHSNTSDMLQRELMHMAGSQASMRSMTSLSQSRVGRVSGMQADTGMPDEEPHGPQEAQAPGHEPDGDLGLRQQSSNLGPHSPAHSLARRMSSFLIHSQTSNMAVVAAAAATAVAAGGIPPSKASSFLSARSSSDVGSAPTPALSVQNLGDAGSGAATPVQRHKSRTLALAAAASEPGGDSLLRRASTSSSIPSAVSGNGAAGLHATQAHSQRLFKAVMTYAGAKPQAAPPLRSRTASTLSAPGIAADDLPQPRIRPHITFGNDTCHAPAGAVHTRPMSMPFGPTPSSNTLLAPGLLQSLRTFSASGAAGAQAGDDHMRRRAAVLRRQSSHLMPKELALALESRPSHGQTAAAPGSAQPPRSSRHSPPSAAAASAPLPAPSEEVAAAGGGLMPLPSMPPGASARACVGVASSHTAKHVQTASRFSHTGHDMAVGPLGPGRSSGPGVARLGRKTSRDDSSPWASSGGVRRPSGHSDACPGSGTTPGLGSPSGPLPLCSTQPGDAPRTLPHAPAGHNQACQPDMGGSQHRAAEGRRASQDRSSVLSALQTASESEGGLFGLPGRASNEPAFLLQSPGGPAKAVASASGTRSSMLFAANNPPVPLREDAAAPQSRLRAAGASLDSSTPNLAHKALLSQGGGAARGVWLAQPSRSHDTSSSAAAAAARAFEPLLAAAAAAKRLPTSASASATEPRAAGPSSCPTAAVSTPTLSSPASLTSTATDPASMPLFGAGSTPSGRPPALGQEQAKRLRSNPSSFSHNFSHNGSPLGPNSSRGPTGEAPQPSPPGIGWSSARAAYARRSYDAGSVSAVFSGSPAPLALKLSKDRDRVVSSGSLLMKASTGSQSSDRTSGSEATSPSLVNDLLGGSTSASAAAFRMSQILRSREAVQRDGSGLGTQRSLHSPQHSRLVEGTTSQGGATSLMGASVSNVSEHSGNSGPPGSARMALGAGGRAPSAMRGNVPNANSLSRAARAAHQMLLRGGSSSLHAGMGAGSGSGVGLGASNSSPGHFPAGRSASRDGYVSRDSRRSSERVSDVTGWGMSEGGRSSLDVYALTGHAGTPLYMAPEVANQEMYNEKADVYSFGIVMYEVLGRTLLLSGRTREEVDYLSARIQQGFRPRWLEQIPGAECWRLIQCCWAQDPVKRPAMHQVVQQLEALLQRLAPAQDSHKRNSPQAADKEGSRAAAAGTAGGAADAAQAATLPASHPAHMRLLTGANGSKSFKSNQLAQVSEPPTSVASGEVPPTSPTSPAAAGNGPTGAAHAADEPLDDVLQASGKQPACSCCVIC